MKLVFLDTFLCVASERVFILVRVIYDSLFAMGDLIVQCARLRFASDAGVHRRDSMMHIKFSLTMPREEHTSEFPPPHMIGW